MNTLEIENKELEEQLKKMRIIDEKNTEVIN